MGIFDGYLKIQGLEGVTDESVPGGGGSAGAIETEPYQPINLDEFLKAPSTEEMNEKQDALLTFEKDYEAITLAIDEDYELYKEYTKQLDDLEIELQEAPNELQSHLNQKYNQIRDEHNILVEKLQGNTKRQKEIHDEYTKVRTTYDKDIEIYNRWAEGQNRKQEETKEALKETKDPTWGNMIYHTLRAGLNQANANFWNVFRMVEMGKIKAEDKIDDFFFPGAKDRNEKFKEKYGKDPNFSLPLDVLTDLVVDAEKVVVESAPQAESKNWLKQSINIGLRPIPQIAMSAMAGAAIPMAGAGQVLTGSSKLTADFMKTWARMTPFGTGAGAGKAREIEKEYIRLDEEAPYMKMLISGTLTGLGEMATEMPVYLGVMRLLKHAGAGTLINKGAKTIISKYGKAVFGALSNIFLQGIQEGEMYVIGKSIDQAMGDPQDWSKEDIAEGTWRDFYGGLMMGFCTLGIGGGISGSVSIATKSKRALDRLMTNEDDLQTTLRKIAEYQGIIMEEPKAEALAYKAKEEEEGKETTPKTKPKPYTATVYRGTKEGVTPVDEGIFGKGTYYSTNKEYAETYGGVETSKITLKNPFIINNQKEADKFWNEVTRPVRDKAIKEGRTKKEANDLAAIAAREFLEGKGYDGVIAKNIIEKGDEVVVFYPEKVEPEPIKLTKDERNLLENTLELDKRIVPVGTIRGVVANEKAKAKLKEKGYTNKEGYLTQKGKELVDILKARIRAEEKGIPIAEKEIKRPITDKQFAKVGLNEELIVGKINGEDFYTNTHVMLKGEIEDVPISKRKPKLIDVVPEEEGAKIKPVTFSKGKDTFDKPLVWFDNKVAIEETYYDFIIKKFPKAEFRSVEKIDPKNPTPKAPIKIYENDEFVGVVMPMSNVEQLGEFKVEPKEEVRPKEELKVIPEALEPLAEESKTKGQKVNIRVKEEVIPKTKPKPLEEQLKVSQKEINRLKGIIKTIKGNKEKRQAFKKDLVEYIKKNMPFAIQNKMISAVKNVSGDKALEKAMEKVDQYTIEHYTRQYTKTITKELKAKRIKPKRMKSGMLKGRFIPVIQDKLDFIRANINGSRIEAQEKIQKNIALFNQGKATNIQEENELLNMVGIKEMNLETLQSTLINIKSLKKEGKTLRAIKVAKDQARQEQKRVDTLESLTGKEVEIDKESGKAKIDSSYRTLPRTKEWGGVLSGVKKFVDGLNNWQFHWDSLLDKLSALHKASKPFQSPLSKIGDTVHFARVNNIKSLEEVLDMIQIKFVEAYEAISKKDVLKITKKLREEIDLGEFKNSEGSKVHLVLSKEQIIKKVMQLEDPSLEPTFEKGMLYTEEIENALKGALSKKDLAWIKGQREIYDYMWERINPIFEDMYGIHFPYNPFYSGTIRRDMDLDTPEASLAAQDAFRFVSILNPSLKARSKTKQSLVYDEATNSLMNYVMQMEHFIAWAKPLNDLRSIFGDKRVKSVINELYGHNVLGKINSFLDDMTRDGVDKAKIIKWVDTIRFNFTRAILAKPHLGLKQIPSVLAYMTEMSPVDFVKGINNFWKSPIKNYKYLIEHSPYAKARFGEGFERDIHGALKSDYYHVLAHSHKISDLMMGFVRAGDRFAVMQGMWAVMYAETNGKTTNASTKVIEDAFTRAAIITDRTQPSFTTESLAAGQRGGSLLKLFTMFQTQPNKYYQLIANNARNFKYGRGSRMKAASNIALAWAILPMLFQFIGDGGKWIKKHQLRALLLGGANHVLVFGSMIKSMYGWLIEEAYDVEASPVFATLREIEYCLAKIAKWSDPDRDITPEDIHAFTEHFAKGLGQMIGLPTPYGVQVKKAIESGDYRQLLFSEYILNQGVEKKKKKKPYVKSYSGDKYSKYLKSGYSKKSKYSKYLKY